MFAHGRANYLLDFKECIEAMLEKEKKTPKYRTYPIQSFVAHMCLNRRFPNAEARIQRIRNAMVKFKIPRKAAVYFKNMAIPGVLVHNSKRLVTSNIRTRFF